MQEDINRISACIMAVWVKKVLRELEIDIQFDSSFEQDVDLILGRKSGFVKRLLSRVEEECGVQVFPGEEPFIDKECPRGIANVFQKFKEERPNCYYPFSNLGTLVFPTEQQQITQTEIQTFKETIEAEVYQLSKNPNRETLLFFIKKHFSFIPAFREEDKAFISIYDYLKYISGVIRCVYSFNHIDKFSEKPFLLVSGDLSGIQEFIYNISSSQALKLVRGRSFYIELFNRHVMDMILKASAMGDDGVLMEGGGNFCLLVSNLENFKKEFHRIHHKVNRWLFNKFGERLYFNIAWVEVGKDFPIIDMQLNTKEELWVELASKLEKSKRRKFDFMLADVFEVENDRKKNTCLSCHHETSDALDEAGRCPMCSSMFYLGDKLLDASNKENNSLGLQALDAPLTNEDNQIEMVDTWYALKEIPVEGEWQGYRITTYDHCLISHQKEKLIYSDLYSCGINAFDELVQKSKGTRRIGILRMDVDNLGALIHGQTGLLKKMIISSRLNLFFKDYIRRICSFEHQEMFEYMAIGDKERAGRYAAVVYAGGDDLFIVGAWDDILELSVDIQQAFKIFTGKQVTLSAGLTIHKPKFPFYQMAELSKKAVEQAKSDEKDSICPFYSYHLYNEKLLVEAQYRKKNQRLKGKTTRIKLDLNWKEFMQVALDVQKIDEIYPLIPRTVFYKIKKMIDEYRMNDAYYLPMVNSVFHVHRNLPMENKKAYSYLENLLLEAMATGKMKYMHIIFMWTEYLNRRKERDD